MRGVLTSSPLIPNEQLYLKLHRDSSKARIALYDYRDVNSSESSNTMACTFSISSISPNLYNTPQPTHSNTGFCGSANPSTTLIQDSFTVKTTRPTYFQSQLLRTCR